MYFNGCLHDWMLSTILYNFIIFLIDFFVNLLASMVAFLKGIMGQSQDLHWSMRIPSIPSWTNRVSLPCCSSMQVLDIPISIILPPSFRKNIINQVVFKICHPVNCISFGRIVTNSAVLLVFFSLFLSWGIIVAGLGEIGCYYFSFRFSC